MKNGTNGTNGKTGQAVGLDDLTGVWNRSGFIAAAAPMLALSKRRAAPTALAYFDLCATDVTRPLTPDVAMQRVLLSMTSQMRKGFRETDLIGRIETFRFAVLLPDCDDEALAAVEGVRLVPETTELSLAVALVRSTSEMTLDELMLAAAFRTQEIRSEQTGA